jgi:integrase/recombinase XerD
MVLKVGRKIFISKATRKSVWRYLALRENDEYTDSPFILNREDRHFTPNSLRLLITRIGKRAKVKKAYPHKFRHTFAITYLRTGGDIFKLQVLLGHGSSDMMRD